MGLGQDKDEEKKEQESLKGCLWCLVGSKRLTTAEDSKQEVTYIFYKATSIKAAGKRKACFNSECK